MKAQGTCAPQSCPSSFPEGSGRRHVRLVWGESFTQRPGHIDKLRAMLSIPTGIPANACSPPPREATGSSRNLANGRRLAPESSPAPVADCHLVGMSVKLCQIFGFVQRGRELEVVKFPDFSCWRLSKKALDKHVKRCCA